MVFKMMPQHFKLHFGEWFSLEIYRTSVDWSSWCFLSMQHLQGAISPSVQDLIPNQEEFRFLSQAEGTIFPLKLVGRKSKFSGKSEFEWAFFVRNLDVKKPSFWEPFLIPGISWVTQPKAFGKRRTRRTKDGMLGEIRNNSTTGCWPDMVPSCEFHVGSRKDATTGSSTFEWRT